MAEDNSTGWVRKLANLALDQFLPLVLTAGMLVGLVAPGPGIWAAERSIQVFSTFGIFVLSGLGLRRKQAAQALQSWGAALFGFISILVITPLAGFAALRLPLHPPELALGLAVFCCMPCTLSSGVSLTQAVDGNTALALLLTSGSNLLGILTMPFVLCAVLGGGTFGNAIEPVALLKTLVQSILIPLSLGAAARAFLPRVREWVDAKKQLLSILTGSLLALVPWMQVSRAVKQNVQLSLCTLAAVVAAGIAIHLVYLAVNITAVNVLNLGGHGEEGQGIRRAIILVASQKTLPIAVTVLNGLANLLKGPIGLAVIPCVTAHLSQILVDSLLVSFWRRSDQRTVGGSDMPTQEFITKVTRNY